MIKIIELNMWIFILMFYPNLVFSQEKLDNNTINYEKKVTIDISTDPETRIFKSNPNIQSIYIGYKNATPNNLHINFLDSTKKEIFNLDFEGDRYILSNKYPKIYELTSNSYLNIISNKNLYATNDLMFVEFSKEKTVLGYFKSNINLETRSQITANIWAYPPKWISGNFDLAGILSKNLKETDKVNSSDSILIFKIKIDKNGNFRSSTLLFGNQSKFAKNIQEILSKSETHFFKDGTSKWKPAIRYNISRPFESAIKIYIKLEPNRKIVILTPTINRNWTGE